VIRDFEDAHWSIAINAAALICFLVALWIA
jgi:hypothetical protein